MSASVSGSQGFRGVPSQFTQDVADENTHNGNCMDLVPKSVLVPLLITGPVPYRLACSLQSALSAALSMA